MNSETKLLTQFNNLKTYGVATSICLSGDGKVAFIGVTKKAFKGSTVPTGIVNIYTLINNEWVYQHTLAPEERVGKAQFGASIASNYDGTRVVIGAPYSNFGYTETGSVHAYHIPNLEDINRKNIFVKVYKGYLYKLSHFGKSVDIDNIGSNIIIGAPESNNNVGAALLINNKNTIVLNPPENITPVSYQKYGSNVKISADSSTVLITEPRSRMYDVVETSFVHIYKTFKVKDLITNINYFESITERSLDSPLLGISLDINYDGTKIFISSPGAKVNGVWRAGKVEIYQFDFNKYYLFDVLYPDNNLIIKQSKYGWQVCCSEDGNRILISQPFITDEDKDLNYSGSIVVYQLLNGKYNKSISFEDFNIPFNQLGFRLSASSDLTTILYSRPGPYNGKVPDDILEENYEELKNYPMCDIFITNIDYEVLNVNAPDTKKSSLSDMLKNIFRR